MMLPTKKMLLTAVLALGLLPSWMAVRAAEEELKVPDEHGLAGMAAVALEATAERPSPIIVMTGGANFPNAIENAKTPEERGAKVFSTDVSVMPVPGGSEDGKYIVKKVGSMPYPVGYAAFAPSDKGMVVAGGCNATGHLADVTRVNVVGTQVSTEALPALPVSVAYPAFAVAGNKLYVFGGQEKADSTTCLNRSFVMNLADPAAGWQEVAPMPGEGRMLAGAGTLDGKIYVAGGCSLHPDAKGQAERTYLDSVVCYDPATNAWTTDLPAMPETIVGAANPLPVMENALYVVCGDPGEYYRASLAGNAPEEHPGQNMTIYSYTPSTGVWSKVGAKGIGVATCPAIARGNAIVVISGETHPGVRTPVVSIIEKQPEPSKDLMFLADLTPWMALIVAILAIMAVCKKGLKKPAISPNAPITSPGKWAWIAVAVLWVVVMLNYFDRQLLAVLNKSLTEGFSCIEMSQAQFGIVTSAFLIVYAALSPVGGYLADRYSRSFIIMCSLVVWSVVTWMTGKAETYEELIFWRAAMGVSEAFYIPAALALITDYHRGSTRSMATGLHMSGIYAGQVLAGCGAMMAGEPCQMGWRLTFEVFGFVGVAYGLIVLFFLRDPKPEDAATAAESSAEVAAVPAAPAFTMGQMLKSIFTGRGMYMLLLMISFAGFANWFLLGWYPRLLQDMFNISEAEAGPQATFWINIAKYISVLACAVIADRWYLCNKNARAYVPGIAFCLAGPCVLLAMMFGTEIGLAAVLALVAMQGVAQGSMDATLMPVLRTTIDERFAATGYGLLNLTSVGAGALVSWLGGMLKDAGTPLSAVLSLAGVLMMLCGIILFLLPKKENA